MSMAPKEEYEARIRRARELMRVQGMDGLVVTDPVTFFYFSGQKMPAWMKARPSAFVLPLEGEPTLISWSGPEMFARVYNRPYPSWIEDRRIYPEIPFTTDDRVDWGILGALRDRGLDRGVVGIELGQETTLGLPYNDFVWLQEQLPHVRFVESGAVVWGCRMVKSAWEIECARKACEIGGKAWHRAMDELEPGASIREIQTKILAYYYDGGADLDSEVPTVLGATGPGGTFRNGDILYLDGGPAFMGYRMDFTRRACFGKPSARQLDEHNGMWALLFKLMDRMKPGVALAELFEYSQSLLAQRPDWRNYSQHPALRIGHGIGLESEPPSMNAFDQRVLVEGMAITPEPKIESEDGLVNPEEHVVITATGCDILSTFPGWELHVVN